jgi:hypothetical protein
MTIKEIRVWYETETGDKAEGESYRMWLETIATQKINMADWQEGRINVLEGELEEFYKDMGI